MRGCVLGGEMEEFEVTVGESESLFILDRDGKISDGANFGLCKSGGLQLLDEVGDENCLDVELSPKIREDAIVGDLSFSSWFRWLGLVFTNDDIGLDKFWYSERLMDAKGWLNVVFSENLNSPKFDVDMGALLITSSTNEQQINVSSILVRCKHVIFSFGVQNRIIIIL